MNISGNPVSDHLTKCTILEYGPPSASPIFFLIHMMYYQIQKADRPEIRDTDHPSSILNHKNTDHPQQQKNHSHLYSLMGETYASTKGPAAAGFINVTSCSWIHWSLRQAVAAST